MWAVMCPPGLDGCLLTRCPFLGPTEVENLKYCAYYLLNLLLMPFITPTRIRHSVMFNKTTMILFICLLVLAHLTPRIFQVESGGI